MTKSEYEKMQNRLEVLEKLITEMGADLQDTKKQHFKKKIQSVRMDYMHRALCVDTLDPWKENRVRFYHPILHEPETPIHSLPFARPVSSMGGFDDCGLSWVPPAGSTLILMFDNGSRDHPYYFGTTWHRDRGPGGQDFPIPIPEYQNVSAGHRGGYLVGPNDESQVLPPWNTESYNGNDIDSLSEFTTDPEEQRRTTYPNIYGFKTPEKHMWKGVDGNAKCNRRWKRLEMLSSCGNWFIMKDDHMHYGGQWAHPTCPPPPESAGTQDVSICSEHRGDLPFYTDPHGRPIEGSLKCEPGCSSEVGVSCGKVLGGHPSTPGNPPNEPTAYFASQGGANKFFKHQNECRPYKGPGTPQNNACDLPQSGIQMLSIGGHTMVMDDSVEEPKGAPIWERSLESFDFGCNNKCLGVMYMKSMTGHRFVMSDVEDVPTIRGKSNYVELVSGNGNKIQLNDETIGEGECEPCPPNYAGPNRGIHIQSTSDHQINMVDHMNQQCGPCRAEGGTPVAKATQAYIQIRSGYGLEMRYNDDNSQEETQNQWIQITNPQCAGGSDPYCNRERGPHFMRFQGRPQGQPGIIFLRAGGHAIRSTYDMDIVLVGDKEKNPSDKFTYVSKMFITSTEDIHFRYSGELHIFFAEKYILLMAGRDCPPAEGKKCKGPCLYPVVVGRCPKVCPITGFIHWTEQSLSERVFASAYHPCQVPCGNEDCPPGGEPQPCEEDEETQSIDTGAGTVTF